MRDGVVDRRGELGGVPPSPDALERLRDLAARGKSPTAAQPTELEPAPEKDAAQGLSAAEQEQVARAVAAEFPDGIDSTDLRDIGYGGMTIAALSRTDQAELV